MPIFSQIEALLIQFPFITEELHFQSTAYKIKRKIMFTHNAQENRLCVKLPLIEQSVYCDAFPKCIHAVPNAWGKQGWTLVQIETIDLDCLLEMFDIAYRSVANMEVGAPLFSVGLSRPAQRALVQAQILSLEVLSSWSEKRLVELHGLGKSAIPYLQAELLKIGLKLNS